jgi:hypothetical protein
MKAPASESPDHRHGKGRAGQKAQAVSQAVRPGGDALALPNTDWLRHALRVTGATSDVAEFRTAAAGPGAIPWVYPDLDVEEDDRFLALVNPPDGSPGLRPAAARVLARELREAVFQHQSKVRGQTAENRSCPFDLHALVPVPPDLLERGPEDAICVTWLRTHWGVLQALRHVRPVPSSSRKLRGKKERMAIEFWSADWTPWPAIAAIRERFPGLTFAVTPDYGDG